MPNLLGGLKQLTGSFAGGFFVFGAVGLGCAACLLYAARAWVREFLRRGVVAVELAPAVPAAPADGIITGVPVFSLAETGKPAV